MGGIVVARKSNRDRLLGTFTDPTGKADWLRSRGEGHAGFGELLRPGSGKRPAIDRAINRSRWRLSNTLKARKMRPTEQRAMQPTVNQAASSSGALPLSVPVPSDRQGGQRAQPSREGQSRFRSMVISAYGQCAITGCRDEAALQAAHIIPYVDDRSHALHNGICLRADIHCLFDRNLIGVSAECAVWVSAVVTTPEYRALHGKPIAVPPDQDSRPCMVLLSGRHKYI